MQRRPHRADAPTLTQLSSGLRYATIYTMFPVFSLVLDQDVKPEMAMLYPELYKDLTKVRPEAPLAPAPPGHSGLHRNISHGQRRLL